ncbi:MAG TPA: acyl-CoA dehydrogenase family protein, partial [Phaeodactylibacter sp.]|nr:acyl-CoA dehydrogenase family protein [Phaeodactylibacter sp.]
MTDDFLEHLQMIEQSVKDFAETHIRPHVMEWDEAQYFPIDTMKAMGKLGFLGVLVPEKYNGSGLGYQEYISILT